MFGRRVTGSALTGLFVLAVCSEASAAPTRDEALALAFPGARVQAEQVFLTTGQQKAVAALSGGEVASALIARYVATKDGHVVGRAYVDTHTVRTKKETLLISLDADGRVKRVDVTAFLEPPEYEAPAAWLGQFQSRSLAPDVDLNRAIRSIAGGTLTARSVTAAVRRVLAIDQVLRSGAGQ